MIRKEHGRGRTWQGTRRHGRGRVPGSNRQTPRGKHRVEYYDELGICTESFVIEPGGENVAVSIPIGMWHTVHALKSGTCILEMKNGKYEPLTEVDILK